MRLAALALTLLSLPQALLQAADPKIATAQGGNRDATLQAELYLTAAQIEAAAGAKLPGNLIVVKVRVTPKTEGALAVGPDDFTLIWRKTGERSPALPLNFLGTRERDTLLAVVARRLKDSSTKEPVEGLVFFELDAQAEGKVKSKDLALVYRNKTGQFVVDFN